MIIVGFTQHFTSGQSTRYRRGGVFLLFLLLIPLFLSSSSFPSIPPSIVAKRTVFLSQEHLFTAYVANAEKKPHNMCSPKQDRSSYNQSSLVLVSDLSNQKLKSK